MDLGNFDLNLLVVLHTLLLERSVSRAARRLNLSQPALSASLKRLRTALQDPLLVRDGLHMVPTPRAEQLMEPLRSILGNIENLVASPEAFDPKQVQRTVRIGTNDYGAFILIPKLLKRWQAIAPGIDVEVWEIAKDATESIADPSIDLLISDSWSLRECPCQEVLFAESFTCLVRQNHPRIQSTLSLENYLAEEHVLVSPRGRVLGNVDAVLSEQGLQRRVRLTLPHVLAVPAAIAATDCLVTLATRIAGRLATDYGLRQLPPPIPLEAFNISMAWSTRKANEPVVRWLRAELKAVTTHLNG
jgi:DNA-binding transcriptional LysR family regulator